VGGEDGEEDGAGACHIFRRRQVNAVRGVHRQLIGVQRGDQFERRRVGGRQGSDAHRGGHAIPPVSSGYGPEPPGQPLCLALVSHYNAVEAFRHGFHQEKERAAMISTREASRPVQDPSQAPEPTTTLEQQNLRRRTLEAVTLAVRRDCTVEPERYLEEVYVPFGGE